MADKKRTLTNLSASAVAEMMSQDPADWGKAEHLATLRYLVVDAINQAPSKLAAMQKAEEEAAKKAGRAANTVNLSTAELVNAMLKEVFTEETEWSYASEFKKLLIATGDLVVKSKASGYK